jgi:hypothetical protein
VGSIYDRGLMRGHNCSAIMIHGEAEYCRSVKDTTYYLHWTYLGSCRYRILLHFEIDDDQNSLERSYGTFSGLWDVARSIYNSTILYACYIALLGNTTETSCKNASLIDTRVCSGTARVLGHWLCNHNPSFSTVFILFFFVCVVCFVFIHFT